MNIKIQNITKHNRIILYFLIAVVIPSIVLGFLAFRGIQNDQALIEKEQKRIADKKATEIYEFVDNKPKELLAKLLERQDLIGNNYPGFFQDTLLQEFVAQNRSLETVFLHNGKELQFLKYSLLFLPEENITNEAHNFTPQVVDLDLAWKYEYQESKFNSAAKVYQQAFNQNPPRIEKGYILNALARIEKKRGNHQSAVDHYNHLIQDYSDIRLQGKIPIGLIAQLEIIKILISKSTFKTSCTALIQLRNKLYSGDWILSKSAFHFLSDQMDQIQQSIPYDSVEPDLLSKLDSLKNAGKLLAQNTEVILQLRSELVEIYDHQIHQGKTDGFQKEVSAIKSGELFAEVAEGKNNEIWGLVLNKEKFVQNELLPYLQIENEQHSWNWDIQDESGNLHINIEIAYDEKPLQYPISSSFNGYTLLAFAQPETLMNTFLGNDQGLYFFIFLFIGAILITGILLMIYMVNRELQLNQMKSNFIATVSHEFKSPITAIRQMAEMFQNNRVPDERKQKYYGVMMQEGERLAHLVDNILDMARIEQGKKRYDFKPHRIQETINQTVAKYRDRYAGRGLMFNVHANKNIPEVTMDEESIQQVLHNLIDNAIKYSGNAKYIDLSAVQQNGTIAITIKDHGIGIEKEELAKIFDRFYRVKSDETSGIKGSGIGLTLVKKIVEAHGGKTEVESQPSEGTTVTFLLPIYNNGLS